MNELTKFLVEGILNEETEKVVALFGGGFKPPTKGHLDVVNQGIKQNPEVTEIKILVGGGERNGFTQDQAVKIWNLYNDLNFIDKPATIIPVSSPFTYYKNYLKDNPDDKVYVFIGSRPDDEKDQFDVKQRSEFVKKYSDNVIPVEVSTTGGVSGTLARKLFKTDIDGFRNMFPENLLDQDFDKILDILNNKSTDSTPKPASNKTEPLTPKEENIDPKSQKKHKGKSAPFGSAYEPVNEVNLITGKDFGKDKLKEITPIIFLSHDNFKENEIKKIKKDLDSDPYISSRYVGIVVDLNKLKTDKGKLDFNKLIKAGNSIVNSIKNQFKNKFSKLDPAVYVGYNPKNKQIKDISGNKFVVLDRLDAGPIVVNSKLQFRRGTDEMIK
jgi:phosphopantetheine adenylyltransferase